MDAIAELIGWVLEGVLGAGSAPPAEPAQSQPHAARGSGAIRWSTGLLTMASIALTIAVPVLWATGAADGLTLVGLVVGALIVARVAQLLARYQRNTALLSSTGPGEAIR